MASVMVTINGRHYRMACEDGEEPHLMTLAADLDARIVRLRETFGQIGDMRLTVMAALTIADELHDTRERSKTLERDVGRFRDADVTADHREEAAAEAIAAAFNTAAERIEKLTRTLNAMASGAGVAIG